MDPHLHEADDQQHTNPVSCESWVSGLSCFSCSASVPLDTTQSDISYTSFINLHLVHLGQPNKLFVCVCVCDTHPPAMVAFGAWSSWWSSKTTLTLKPPRTNRRHVSWKVFQPHFFTPAFPSEPVWETKCYWPEARGSQGNQVHPRK